MKVAALLVVALLPAALTSACARYGVVVDVDASAVPDADGFDAAFWADDGGGCEGQRFVAVPTLTLITKAPLPLDGVELPRLSDKLVIVEARRGANVVGRGCSAVADVDGVVHVSVVVTPTLHLRDVSAESVVVGNAAVLDGPGNDGAFSDHVDAVVASDEEVGVAAAAVRAVVFGGDGAVVADDVVVSGAGGAVVFTPARAPAGPLRVVLTPENPATDDDAVVPGFAVPVFELFETPLSSLRPFVVDDVPLFAGVGSAPGQRPALSVFDDGAHGDVIAQAVTSLSLVGVATDNASDLFVVVVDGRLAFVARDGTTVVGSAVAVDDTSAFRFFSGASCDAPLGLPGVIGDGNAQFLIDLTDDGAAVAARLDLAQSGPVVGSSCVIADDGSRHRVAVFGGDRPGVLDLGDGITSAGDLNAVPIEAGLENTIGLIARDDGLLLSSEADAGEVLVRLRRLSGRALVDAGVPPARLPSPPTFLAAGNFFGGAADLFAVLALGTVVRPDLAAVYGVGATSDGDAIAGGIAVPACAPAAACSDALAVDVDGDGVLEVLTSVNGIAVVVRFR